MVLLWISREQFHGIARRPEAQEQPGCPVPYNVGTCTRQMKPELGATGNLVHASVPLCLVLNLAIIHPQLFDGIDQQLLASRSHRLLPIALLLVSCPESRASLPFGGEVHGEKSQNATHLFLGPFGTKAIFPPHRTVSMHTRHCSSDLRQSPRNRGATQCGTACAP